MRKAREEQRENGCRDESSRVHALVLRLHGKKAVTEGGWCGIVTRDTVRRRWEQVGMKTVGSGHIPGASGGAHAGVRWRAGARRGGRNHLTGGTVPSAREGS